MLLSSSKFTRTMMDDFVDQDWFEESAEDEAVKPPPMAGVEQQQPQPSPLHVPLENGFGSFHSAPPQGQTDFLELNVPVDEMFFGTTEIAAPQLTELDTHSQQQQQQKMANCPPASAKVVQEAQPKPLQIMEDHHFGIQTQIGPLGGGVGPVQQNGHGIQQRECFYADWPPTTSSNFSTTQSVTNALKMQKQKSRDEQQQRLRHTQQQQRWTTPLGDNNGTGQRHQFEQQNEFGGAQMAKPNGGNVFPMTRIIVHDQSAGQFPAQPFVCSSSAIESHQNALFHSSYSSPCSAPNSQCIPTISEHQQIVVGEEQLQQPNFSLRVENATEFRPIHQNQLKTTKRPTKIKPPVNNSQRSTPFGTENAQGSNETKLDQIATMLFSNSNLATVQFDPQRTIEFGIVLEQTKQLREQEEQGIDVREQLRACEARIAELVQNAMAQQGNRTTAAPTQGTTAKKKSKARKKAPPKAEQRNLQDTDGMAQPTLLHNVSSAVTLSNEPAGAIASTCHQPVMLMTPQEVICRPLHGVAVGTNPVTSNKFKQYSVHSELPCASSSSHAHPFPSSSSISVTNVPVPSLANSHKIFSPISAEVIQTRQKAIIKEIRTQKQQTKKEEKSEAQIAQERERERVRREREREQRRTKLSDAFSALRSSIPTLDYKSPFSDKMDCVKRLLPFGLFAETELSDEFLQKFDGELHRHSDFLCERMETLKERFQSVFLTEALCEMKEQRNLLLRLDVEFEKAQIQKAVEEQGKSFRFPIVSSSNLLDWEYDDSWDRDRYRDISPFTSPPQSPVGRETKSEMTDVEEDTQKEEKREGTEVGSEASATPAKIGNIRLTLPKYEAPENNTTEEQSESSHSPNKGQNQHKDDELEQCQPRNSEDGDRHEKVAFSLSNEMKVTHRSSDGPPSMDSTSSATSREFRSETLPIATEIPSSLPLIPSFTPEIPFHESLCRTVETPSSSVCHNKLVEIDCDSVVKALTKSLLGTLENGAENGFYHQQTSPKEEFRERDEEPKGQQGVHMEPVKLKIKLDKRINGKEERMNDLQEGRKEIMCKLERKRLKAEKKERKRQAKLEKERMKREQRERESFEDPLQPNPSSAHPQNGEKLSAPSLKLSLRRLVCWRGTNNVTPEYSSNLSSQGIHSTGESTNLTNGISTAMGSQMKPENESGSPLKLRIPKLILNGDGPRGNCSGEVKSAEHRKKSRKRKSHEEKPKTREEKEELPKKVPRLKIRYGTVYSEEKTQTTDAKPKTDPNHYSPLKSEGSPGGKKEQQTGKTEHAQSDPLSPSDFFRQSTDNSRVQFSPCCSEESDDDALRNRTNELFSKLCQD